MTAAAAVVSAVAILAVGGATNDGGAAGGGAGVAELHAAAMAAIDAARIAKLTDIGREVTLPSIERLVQDADERAAHVTVPDRDWAFVRRSLETARAFAARLVAGEDPYATATGMLVKAYRAEWDGTLQPYALYVPPGYDAKKRWPLIIALHGAYSDHRHNLRRVFGLDNRPGETDAEASRNELPLPDVPAIVVSPLGRGELMGWDGLGGEDLTRVMADIRRAYSIDPEHITLTGLSMGGGGAWAIGLRHPELFAALAPVCAAADFARMVPKDGLFYGPGLLDRLSPRALAENARHMQVFIFHGAKDPVIPVGDSRQMVERFRALGFLGKNVRYTELPNVGHEAWKEAYKGAALLRTLAAIKRDPAAPKEPVPPPPPGEAIPGWFGKSVPRQHPHMYVYGTNGPADAVAASRGLALGLADWGPMIAARFIVKADREVTAEDRARFNLVIVGAAPLNSVAPPAPFPPPLEAKIRAGGFQDWAYREQVADSKSPSGYSLVFGALTPRGFVKLQRFAHHNAASPAPEPNRPVILFGLD
jgi:poly(3-hydroxybutyrate) depolymerase